MAVLIGKAIFKYYNKFLYYKRGNAMKKFASLILIAVFAVAVAFVGCKKEEAPAPATDQPVQEQPAEQAPAQK